MGLIAKNWNRCTHLICFVLCSTCTASTALAETLDLKLGLTSGIISYEEKGSTFPVVSDWEGFFIGPTATAILRYNPSYEIHLDGALWVAGKDTERWDVDGDFSQENDLEAFGSEWGVSLVKNWLLDKDIETSVRIGPSIVFEKFTRDDFVFFTNNNESGRDSSTIDEDVFFTSIDLGFSIKSPLSKNYDLAFDAELGYIALDQADNDAIPETLEGSGGYRFNSSLFLYRKLKNTNEVGIGFVYSQRTLDGESTTQSFNGRSAEVEWPENELITYGCQFFWQGSF